MMDFRRLIRAAASRRAFSPLLFFACAALLVGGCGDEASPEEEAPAEPASPGTFQAEAGGALQATLEGQSVARFDSAARLVGLEFDDAVDTARAGLSFELPAQPAAPERTYTVTPRDQGGREDTTFSLMNAYLRLRGYEFAARAGSLQVRRDSAGLLRGTFDLRLRGSMEAASDEPATVTARGRFEGTRPVPQSAPRP